MQSIKSLPRKRMSLNLNYHLGIILKRVIKKTVFWISSSFLIKWPNHLTTSTKSYSDLPENFPSDSLYFLKNKTFLHDFFSSSGFKDISILRFFLIFYSVNLFFINFFLKISKFIDLCTWKLKLLKFLRYL